MELIKDMEAFMHLFAQALARARGDEQSHVFADVVVGHARSIAKEDDDTNSISAAVQKSDEQMLAAEPEDTGYIETRILQTKYYEDGSSATGYEVPDVSPEGYKVVRVVNGVATKDDADKLALQTQNEHKDALPDSAKTDEQLAAQQANVEAQRSETENDHDQTIQQVHGEQSAKDAEEERATMDANADQQKPTE